MRLPWQYYNSSCYWAHMITFDCNGNCPYCIVEGRGAHAPYEMMEGSKIVEFWNSIEGRETKDLSLIGGEPTLHPDFEEIINGIQGYRRITITTNLATDFYEDESNYLKLVIPKLRINTTFHPSSGLTPELYAERLNKLRRAGAWVDQVGMVQHPALNKEKYREAFARLGVPVRQITFLGFWTKEDGFAKNIGPNTVFPNHDSDPEKIMSECGIDDVTRYIDQCGLNDSDKKSWDCNHGSLCLLVAPDGTVHECHYKLYYNIDPLGNIFDGWESKDEAHNCNHFGACNWCDIPRLRMTGLDYQTARRIDGA